MAIIEMTEKTKTTKTRKMTITTKATMPRKRKEKERGQTMEPVIYLNIGNDRNMVIVSLLYL